MPAVAELPDMFEQAFKNIDDVLWKEAGCTTELDYTEQPSWLLFLTYLDALEQDKADEARLEGKRYRFILDKPYRWESWAGLGRRAKPLLLRRRRRRRKVPQKKKVQLLRKQH